MLRLSKKHLPFITGIFLVILYYIPVLILGENWYVIILDNLDSSIANIKMLKDLNLVFDYSSKEPIIGPVTRSAFRAPWDITILLYTFLPLFWGVIVNSFLARIIAYIGMYLLLSRHVIKDSAHKYFIATLSSLCFAFIAFYSDYGISSAGIPLVVYAFFNLKNNNEIGISLLCIFLYGIYSQLLLSGVFVGIIGVIYYLYIVIHDKKAHWIFISALFFLGIIYLFTNIQLVMDFTGGQINTSHRAEFQNDSTIGQIILSHFKLFCMTQIHTGELITIPILLLFIYNWIITRRTDKISLYILLAIISIVSFGLIYHVILLFSTPGSFIQQFQMDRFYFFLTTLWIVLLARTADLTIENKGGLSIVICTCLIVIGCDFIRNKEYMFQAKKYVLDRQTEPTYHQYFDEDLFAEIHEYINKPRQECPIVSIGMHPAVAQYNGFYCIDGYWNAYPLEYKHEFRKIIESELEKDNDLKNYYDHWGSRCYIFSSELGKEYRYGKNCGKVIQHLDINTEQLRKMNCQYVFSAVPILNHKELDWNFERSFTNDNSFWEVYLYKLPY